MLRHRSSRDHGSPKSLLLLSMCALAALVVGVPAANAAPADEVDEVDEVVVDEEAEGNIEVIAVLEDPEDDQECMDRSGMAWTRVNTPSSFEIEVTLELPLCEPLEAAAVIYLMSQEYTGAQLGADWLKRWPQVLSERVDITFLEAGVTTITWLKDCTPAQFDLVEPPTPEVIDPAGAWHGPLVFPPTDLFGSNGSAVQYFGVEEECDESEDEPPPSTTTTTTTTTSTTTTTTTEPPPQVQGTTTTVVTPTGPPSPPTVAGSTTNSGGAALSVAG